MTFDERKQLARERIKAVLNDLDVDLAPVLVTTTSQITSQLVWIDMLDDEMVKNFGLVRKTPKQGGKKLDDENLAN